MPSINTGWVRKLSKNCRYPASKTEHPGFDMPSADLVSTSNSKSGVINCRLRPAD